jgi:hypothetical protein
MKNSLRKTAVLSAALTALFMPGKAFAAFTGDTTGDLMVNIIGSTAGLVEIFDYFAYTTGILLCLISIFKFKDHVDNPSGTPLSAGVKRFIAGGMFLSLPFMETVVQTTAYGGLVGGAVGTDGAAGGDKISSSNMIYGGMITSGGLDQMVVDFMSDIAGPFEMLLTAFTYIMATGLLILGISRLTKRMDEGPRGPAGVGTIMTFITSGVLFAWGDVAGTFTNSVFNPDISGQASTKAMVDPTGTYLGAGFDPTSINAVIEAVMVFVALVGMIAFIRGWLVLRAFADGQQGATLAQGLTFLVGGTIAINLGDLVNALQVTLGVSGITFN